MGTVGYDFYFLPTSTKCGASTPHGPAAALPPSKCIYKMVYPNEPAGTTLDQARMRLGS